MFRSAPNIDNKFLRAKQRESSYCFQRVLAIAILSVCLSVCPSHGWISQKRCKLEDHQIFTFGCVEDFSFRNRKAFL